MKHCAAAVYEPSDGQYSVTLWFSDAPFTAEELEEFHESSSTSDKTADGKPRTMMHFAFCPGGGKPAASAARGEVRRDGVDVAGSPLLGRQWVFELPKDKDDPEDREADRKHRPGRQALGPHHRREGERRAEVLVGSRLRLHPAREGRVRGPELLTVTSRD